MGESICLMQSFSCSGTPASSQLRDPLSESVSFGRFLTDSSAWDKWSNLSHKRYVEEAAKYSQPGSVAQKKAFFEDYYKKKALLAQENAAAAATETNTQDQQAMTNNAQLDALPKVVETQNEGIDLDVRTNAPVPQLDVISEMNATEDKKDQLASLKADMELSTATTEVSEDSEMEKPLLKDRNANQEVTSRVRKPRPPPVPSLKPAANLWPSAKTPCPLPKPVIRSKKENVTPLNTTCSGIEYSDKIKMSPKPLFSYMSRTPARDVNRCVVNSSKGAKDSVTPLRTPTLAHQAKKSTAMPKSESRRNMNPLEFTTPGAKWRYFGGLENKSRPSPTASSPFNFRTEERAVKRKEKLELKFNAKAPQKVQLQTKLKEKAECELKKLRQSLCFHARPLPSFYKERKTPKDNITKDICKSTAPPPPPQTQRPYSSQKNKTANISAAKKTSNKGLTHPRSLAAMISTENDSPRLLPPTK